MAGVKAKPNRWLIAGLIPVHRLPQGVIAVETEGDLKSNAASGKAGSTVVYDGKVLAFPDWTTAKPIAQREKQSRWVAD